MIAVFDMDSHEATPPITADYVLGQVDDLLIYRYYIGEFKIGTKTKHPFRADKKPSFAIFFGNKLMKFMWRDFGKEESGDCFSLVGKLFNLTYGEAVRKVACDFGLVKGCSIVSKKELQEARKFREELQEKEYLIQVDVRPMTERELQYWAYYNITAPELKENFIYGIKTCWINKKQIYFKPGLHFAYHFPSVDKFKIYSPEETDFKWFGNVSAFHMEIALPNGFIPDQPLIITKSRKDRLILSKLYTNVINCQNEAETAIPKDMDEVFDKLPAKYVWFDSDEPGKMASKKLNSRGYKWINVPNEYYEKDGLKDPGDIIKHFGWEEGSKILTKELKNKGLI